MTERDEINAFVAQANANPDDWQLRLVFADWLEEHNAPGTAEHYRDEAALIKRRLGHHDDQYKARDEKHQTTNRRVDKLHRRKERGQW